MHAIILILYKIKCFHEIHDIFLMKHKFLEKFIDKKSHVVVIVLRSA